MTAAAVASQAPSTLHGTPRGTTSSQPPSRSLQAFADSLKKNHVVLNINNDSNDKKLVVKSSLESFDRVFESVSQCLRKNDEWWSTDVTQKVNELASTLQDEADHYYDLGKRTLNKDRLLRCVKLGFTSTTIFINTSNMDSFALKMTNIALGVCVTFLTGVESIFNFHKRSYQYAETAIGLEGLSRSLKAQLVTPLQQRRDPTELILFVEGQRDKMKKKLIET